MISSQNLTLAVTAIGLLGKESAIFRRVIWWSLGMLLGLCLLVSLLTWMIPTL